MFLPSSSTGQMNTYQFVQRWDWESRGLAAGDMQHMTAVANYQKHAKSSWTDQKEVVKRCHVDQLTASLHVHEADPFRTCRSFNWALFNSVASSGA